MQIVKIDEAKNKIDEDDEGDSRALKVYKVEWQPNTDVLKDFIAEVEENQE
jgi:hypothetical protein